MNSRLALSLGALAMLGLGYQNCGHNYSFDGSSLNKSAALGETLTSDKYFDLVSATQYVCEPFGNGNTGSSAQSGLKASLRYLDQNAVPAGERNSYGISRYFSADHPNVLLTGKDLYFSSVDTPTRNFEDGFQQSDGTLLKDNSGNVLTEYFALEYNSILKLKAGDSAGYYRLATLSDDGATLEYKIGDTWHTLTASDGTHSTKMVCAANAIYLNSSTELPIRLRYFQGPRTRIANQLIWQYVGTENMYPEEKNCNVSSDSFFYVVAPTGSTKTAEYLAMEGRGWSVVAPDNFKLPNNEVNPCKTNLDLEIGAFKILSAADGYLMFSFTTSSAMKATVTVKDASGATVVTAGDTAETSQHQISISGLDVEKPYKLEVVLKSDSLGVMYQRTYNLVPLEKEVKKTE